MADKKHKVLDVRIPKEDQESPEFVNALKDKKFQWQVNVQVGHKVRFMYGNDPEILQDFAKFKGYKILKVTKLTKKHSMECKYCGLLETDRDKFIQHIRICPKKFKDTP